MSIFAVDPVLSIDKVSEVKRVVSLPFFTELPYISSFEDPFCMLIGVVD